MNKVIFVSKYFFIFKISLFLMTKLQGNIYLYKKHGKGVYVGQTRRTLRIRDIQHRSENKTKFDRDIKKNRAAYGKDGPEILITKCWTYDSKNEEEEGLAFKACHVWMDEEETRFINNYETDHSGFNQTQGGQNGITQSLFEYQRKERMENWTKKYMPALRLIDYCQNGNMWEIPARDFVFIDEKKWNVGTFINSLRNGNNIIPVEYVDELLSFGFDRDKSYTEYYWECYIIPAFQNSSYGKNQKICILPKCHVLDDTEKVKLGLLMSDIRRGNTRIPKKYLPEMVRLGFKRGQTYKESYFKYVLLPIFLRLGNLENIKSNHPDILSGLNVGNILYKLKTGETEIPKEHIVIMTSLGFKRKERKSRKRARE
jgi:hypothetical protein